MEKTAPHISILKKYMCAKYISTSLLLWILKFPFALVIYRNGAQPQTRLTFERLFPIAENNNDFGGGQCTALRMAFLVCAPHAKRAVTVRDVVHLIGNISSPEPCNRRRDRVLTSRYTHLRGPTARPANRAARAERRAMRSYFPWNSFSMWCAKDNGEARWSLYSLRTYDESRCVIHQRISHSHTTYDKVLLFPGNSCFLSY